LTVIHRKTATPKKDTPELGRVIEIDESLIKDHVDEIVHSSLLTGTWPWTR
jgi:hypothetical protein